jgi:hypothetical protein
VHVQQTKLPVLCQPKTWYKEIVPSGRTKFWGDVKSGKVVMVDGLVDVQASLERRSSPQQKAAA